MLRINRNSLTWALNQALNYGDTDIFPEVFEFKAIEHSWNDMTNWLENEDVLNWNVRPPRRCITPKHQFGFRISTQLDPIDFLIFTAIVYEIGADLESRRVPKEERIVHSYRFSPQPDGRMFDEAYTYDSFMQRSKELVEEEYEWIVVADIADFFPRLYHHRVKNSLTKSTKKTNHALAIDNLLNGWNETYSYGIPVGSIASRLLAEVALDDVDRSLLSESTRYIRFSDDFRIFCKTKREAYEKLAFLANLLFENHGLTLQQHKTHILSKEDFIRCYIATEKEEEINTLSNAFEELISELGLGSMYEEIEWDDLTPEQQEEISELNLKGILEEQVAKEEINIPLTRFIIRRLAQLGSDDTLDLIMDSIDKLYPIIPDVVRYIQSIRNIDIPQKNEIGVKVLNLLGASTVSHLEYHRMWLLSLFTKNTEYDNEKRFAGIFSDWADQFTLRETILALGRSKQDEWFRMRKRHVFDFPVWIRRALLLGGSCLPVDERKHWYQSLEARLDPLEIAVLKWGRQNPF